MVYWNRFISYIYRYHDGRKCENSGFAKVAKTGRTGRITIGLKNGIGAREMCMVSIFTERRCRKRESCTEEDRKTETVIEQMGRMTVR